MTIIINETSNDCRQWLRDHAGDFDLDLIVRTTPSSYASFQTVVGRLVGAPAVITTIDAIMPVNDFYTFVRSAAALAQNAVALALTEHVDDENPLWATLDASDGRIRQLGGTHGTLVTAGLYWVPAQRSRCGRQVFPGFATILAGWLPSTRRSGGSFYLASSTSTGHATSPRPNRRTFGRELGIVGADERD